MSFTFGFYRTLHPLESGGENTWFDVGVCCRLPIRDGLHPILGLFDVTDIIRDYLPCGSLVRVDIFRDRRLNLQEIYSMLLSVACCEECTGMVLEVLATRGGERKGERNASGAASHPWEQYQKFMKETEDTRQPQFSIHDATTSTGCKTGLIVASSPSSSGFFIDSSLPSSMSSSSTLPTPPLVSLDCLHSSMYRSLLYAYIHFNNPKYTEVIKSVPEVGRGTTGIRALSFPLDSIFPAGNDGEGKHVEFRRRMRILMNLEDDHYPIKYLEIVINCGMMIYGCGDKDSITRVMTENIPWPCIFLAIILFASPSQIDFFVKHYGVNQFAHLLQSGRNFVGGEWIELSRNDTVVRMDHCGYYLLYIFELLREPTEDKKFLKDVSRIFWSYMTALVGKFYKVTRIHPNAITIHVGKRDIFLFSSIVESGDEDGKFTLHYRCGRKRVSILYIVYLIVGRFAKDKWKNEIAEYMASLFSHEKKVLPLLRGDLCKCRCESEMIKDIILPERFNEMWKRAEEIWFGRPDSGSSGKGEGEEVD